MPVSTIEWKNGLIRLIDQTRLPENLVIMEIRSVEDLAEAICSLRVRGAPAIGIAGAMGVALAANNFSGNDFDSFAEEIRKTVDYLASTRPTAVNLFWALDRMKKVLEERRGDSIPNMKKFLEAEAVAIWEEDKQICRQIGKNGAALLPDNAKVLTHCNAGGLCSADYGTALGVIYAAVEMGKTISVFADETRPLLQGARLTAWELKASGIDVQVICDSAAGFLMQQGKVHCVLVGADRIASNGDTANKIGTYSLAVLAEKHNIPFYVAAPVSTFDFTLASGREIPIEERAHEEISRGFGKQVVPEGVGVYNPAFDRTPGSLIRAIITEKGVFYQPYVETLSVLKKI